MTTIAENYLEWKTVLRVWAILILDWLGVWDDVGTFIRELSRSRGDLYFVGTRKKRCCLEFTAIIPT